MLPVGFRSKPLVRGQRQSAPEAESNFKIYNYVDIASKKIGW